MPNPKSRQQPSDSYMTHSPSYQFCFTLLVVNYYVQLSYYRQVCHIMTVKLHIHHFSILSHEQLGNFKRGK